MNRILTTIALCCFVASFLIISLFEKPSITTTAATFTTTPFNCSVPLTRTNWNSASTAGLSNCAVQKFDTALGQLTSVQLTLGGSIASEVGMENRDTDPQTIAANVSAQIDFHRPDNSSLVVLLPTVNHSENFPATDGGNDFGGTSGSVTSGLTASDSDTLTLTSASDITLFSTASAGATEYVPLQAIATGISNFNASANYSGYVDTFASVNAQVIYTYQAHDVGITISAPTTLTSPATTLPITIGAINNEEEATTGTTSITITVPIGSTLDSISNPSWSGSIINDQLTITTTQPIPATSTQTIDLVITIPPQTTTTTFVANITGAQYDYNTPNNSAVTTVTLQNQNTTTPQPVQTQNQTTTPQTTTQNPPAPTPSVLGVQTVLFRTGGAEDQRIIIALCIIFMAGVIMLHDSLSTSETF